MNQNSIAPSEQLKRVTFMEFLLDFESLPKAPCDGLNKSSDLTGLIFGKLLAIKRLEDNYFGVKWLCRCVCSDSGEREVWSKNLLRGIVSDCGCRERWRITKQRKARIAKRKERQVARPIERQEQRQRDAIAKKKRRALLKQTKAAALKRWATCHGNKTTQENEPETCERKAA